MFQGNVLSKVFKVRSKIFAICKCFFLQTHWLLQRTSTNTATSDNIAKYISKPKSQARIHLSSQYWNTQGMRIRTHHHGQRVWTDPIFCTIRNCNWGHWLPHSWAVHSWQDGRGALWTKGNHIPTPGSSDAQRNFPVSKISIISQGWHCSWSAQALTVFCQLLISKSLYFYICKALFCYHLISCPSQGALIIF